MLCTKSSCYPTKSDYHYKKCAKTFPVSPQKIFVIMQAPFKFRPIPKRDDISEIKANGRRDSVRPKEEDDHWATLYNDTYHEYPISRGIGAKAPPAGIHIGGGNLAPTEEEYKTDYSRTFKKFERSAVPPRADPLPCSDIIKGEDPIPISTCHAALLEANEGRPPYDNTEAKAREVEGKSSHFYFGSDKPSYDTTYDGDFMNRKNEHPSVIDNSLQKSSIAFDGKAGLGPHTKQAEKKSAFPQVGDKEHMNMIKRNFDIGYDNLNYQTTSSLIYKPSRFAKRPESFKAPICAQLSDHGENAPKWTTTYSKDFLGRTPEKNAIDKADLRATHFDPGHEKNEWPARIVEVVTKRAVKETKDLQESNSVFRGDGEGRYQTTAQDLIGNYDRTKDGRGKHVDAREDHLFLGADKVDYGTTAKEANLKAGQGQPAERGVDLHHMRGAGFATGGTFDPNYEEEPMKKEARYGPTIKVDAKYFTSSHFDLDATKGANDHFKTTYYEEICKPRIY